MCQMGMVVGVVLGGLNSQRGYRVRVAVVLHVVR